MLFFLHFEWQFPVSGQSRLKSSTDWSVTWNLTPYSRPKLSDLYTPFQNKLLENHTLHSRTYLYILCMAAIKIFLQFHCLSLYRNNLYWNDIILKWPVTPFTFPSPVWGRIKWNLGTTSAKGWQNLFPIMRFHYIKVLSHIFYFYWGKEYCLLYRGLCKEVCYVKVPLW